ncbi:enoyl-CoA hydratase-related protein [Rhizobium sp. BK251]|uniref:enoyl-CoA hydratase-related protein n=1 Tax=Rhizobium sp. BK251 TaxID=2512125 RepID=UPI001FE20110|nr:enoyl-CoA hydratase-related protein [Rhizobium sp. BK251]
MIKANCHERIGTLLIGNGFRKNAITAGMWRGIPHALRWLTDEAHARVIIIRGGGANTDFSSGADINEFETVRKDAATARIYEGYNSDAFAAIRRCRIPVIAAIRGVCFGGGFGIAAACDLRIADETALFGVPAARLGIAYPAEAVQDIVSALGPQMAKMALFTGAPISAAKMVAAGFLLEAVRADLLDTEVAALADAIAGNAPISIHASKAAVRAAVEQDSDLLGEAEVLATTTFDSADYAEGIAAFAEHRKPKFTGQ